MRCASVRALGRSDTGCGAPAGPRGGAGPPPGAAKGYVGCHAENTAIDAIGPQGRVLSGYCMTSVIEYACCMASAPMTVDLCVTCAARGEAYAGVQFRRATVPLRQRFGGRGEHRRLA